MIFRSNEITNDVGHSANAISGKVFLRMDDKSVWIIRHFLDDAKEYCADLCGSFCLVHGVLL